MIQKTETLTTYTTEGITVELTKRLDLDNKDYWLDLKWANGESALDYGIKITPEVAKRLAALFCEAAKNA